MTRLLVVAGTADAAQFIAMQPPQTEILATTFSQLGVDCIAPRLGLKLLAGALEAEGFRQLLAQQQPDFLVDLSHPFAVEVSQNAKAAAQDCGVPYLRYERQSAADCEFGEGESMAELRHFPDFAVAAEACREISGNILLTIGSKNLRYFCDLPDFHQRFYVRVLAESRILQELETLRIDPGHIFAMKGVASVELNIALARQCQAAALVSKDSGPTGGLLEKIQAAAALHIPLLLIDRPKSEGAQNSAADKQHKQSEQIFSSLTELNKVINKASE